MHCLVSLWWEVAEPGGMFPCLHFLYSFRAAKRRAGSVDVPKPNKSPGIKTLPGELSKG